MLLQGLLMYMYVLVVSDLCRSYPAQSMCQLFESVKPELLFEFLREINIFNNLRYNYFLNRAFAHSLLLLILFHNFSGIIYLYVKYYIVMFGLFAYILFYIGLHVAYIYVKYRIHHV